MFFIIKKKHMKDIILKNIMEAGKVFGCDELRGEILSYLPRRCLHCHNKMNNNKLLAFISLVLSLSIIFAGTNVYAETTFEKIKRTGKVTVGTEAAFPPFEFVEDGKIVGYGKDILDYIIADMGVELNQLDLPWQGILPGVLAGKFDFVATSVSIRAERAKKYAFTVPIAEGTNWVMKRSGDSSIMSPDDLSGKVVCTQLASGSEKATKEWEADMKSRGLKGYKELKLFTAHPEATLALANGTCDAQTQTVPNLAVVAKKQKGVFELVGPITDKTYMAWVTRPEDTDLRDYISSKILEMRDKGLIDEIQDKWFGFRMPIPSEGHLPEGAL